MAQLTRAQIKAYFETGDVPTQAQFADFIDSVKWWDDSTGGSSSGALLDLLWATQTNGITSDPVFANASGIWTPIDSGGHLHLGVDAKKIPAGQGGWIQTQRKSDSASFALGVNSANTAASYPGIPVGLIIGEDGALYTLINGSPSVAAAGPLAVDSFVRLIRDAGSGAWRIETCTDGATWVSPTLIATLTGVTLAGDAFPVVDMITYPTAKMHYPKIYGGV